jgi:hypothetical protein
LARQVFHAHRQEKAFGGIYLVHEKFAISTNRVFAYNIHESLDDQRRQNHHYEPDEAGLIFQYICISNEYYRDKSLT